MKMHEPKLSLGDSIWSIQNDKIVERKIVEIEVTCRPGCRPNPGPQFDVDWIVKYTLTGGHTIYESTPTSPGSFIFTTKEDLIKHLYENS